MTNNENELVSNFRCLIRETEGILLNGMELSDEVLLCFIRARKNDLLRALRLLRNFRKMSKNYPDLMSNLRQTELQRVLNLGHHIIVPRRDEKNGSHIFILRVSHWDSECCSLEEVFRGIVFCFQLLVSEESTQRRGILVMIDVKEFSLRQVRNVTPAFLKKLADLVNVDVFPIRLNGIHIVYEPWIFRIIISMIWPLLSTKIRSRIFFHGYSMTSLHQKVDPSSLPSEYEGFLGPADNMICSKTFPETNHPNLFRCFN